MPTSPLRLPTWRLATPSQRDEDFKKFRATAKKYKSVENRRVVFLKKVDKTWGMNAKIYYEKTKK